MLRRTPLRFTAVALTALVAGAAASPALAATQVAQGTATALRVTAGGQDGYSGTYTATNDGKTETTSGSNSPALSVLGGQDVVTAGTLTQDSITDVRGKNGRVTSCSGLAGSGSSLVAVGRDATCTKPGETLSLNAGSIDLSEFDPTTDLLNTDFNNAILGALPEAVRDQFKTGASTLANQLTTAFQDGFDALGDPGLTLDLDAIEGRCTATPRNASGAAKLAGSGLKLTFPSQANIDPVTLLDFDDNPAPNTKVVTNLDGVVQQVLDSLKSSLQSTIASNSQAGEALQPLIALFDQTGPLTDALGQISDQLQPIEDNLLSITLNRQTRPDDSSIRVTALAADVLPAGKQVLGDSLASIEIGDATCAAGVVEPAAATTPTPTKKSDVPTAIDSGLAGDGGSSPVLPVVGGLMLLAGAGIGVRRVLHTRG